MAIRVKITEFGKLWKSQSPEIRKALDMGLMSGVLRGQKLVQERSPVDTGLYITSWATRRVREGEVHLGNSAPHAPVIEFGARPHTPPIGPLLAWAKRQLKASGPPYPPEVWQLARGVQKKIEAIGQPPKRVLTDSIPKIRQMILEEMRKELEKIGR